MKSKENIKRRDLKHNILKKIVMRFDFSGVDNRNIDKCFVSVEEFLKDKGYTISRNHQTELEFELLNPEIIVETGLQVKKRRDSDIFVYKNDEEGLEISFSDVFLCLKITDEKYVDFIKYKETLISIMKIIQENSPFFEGVRFGLRKINNVIIIGEDKLYDYFSKDFYATSNYFKEKGMDVFNVKENFTANGFNVCSIRNLVRGEYDNNIAYQVTLDSDIYVFGREEVLRVMTDDKMLEEMNKVLFEIFKEGLEIKFLNRLLDDDFVDPYIKGVEKN